MLELIEAVSGRLIGPKTWDRNVKIFGAHFVQSTDCLGSLWYNLCIKLCFGVYEAGNDHEIWFRKEEPILDEWAAHGQPTCSVFGTVKTVPFFMKWTKKVHVLCA